MREKQNTFLAVNEAGKIYEVDNITAYQVIRVPSDLESLNTKIME